MQRNVISAAKWFGASMGFSSLIMTLGIHWTVSMHMARLAEAVRTSASHNVQSDQASADTKVTASETGSDARMELLRLQKEDLRQTDGDWRQFWFNDQPSHLTPDRIHGIGRPVDAEPAIAADGGGR